MAQRAGFRVKDFQLVCSTPSLIMIPPLVIFELMWLRLLMTPMFRAWRTNIICVLEKPGA
jgi:hypothetical protein